MRSDREGEFWNIAAGALIGAVTNVATAYISAKVTGTSFSSSDLILSAISGAASGALAATGLGKVGQIVGNAAIGVISGVANEISNYDKDNFSLGKAALRVGTAGVSGAIAGVIGGKGARAAGTNYRAALDNAAVTYAKVTSKHYGNISTPLKLMSRATRRLSAAARNTTRSTFWRFWTGSVFANGTQKIRY